MLYNTVEKATHAIQVPSLGTPTAEKDSKRTLSKRMRKKALYVGTKEDPVLQYVMMPYLLKLLIQTFDNNSI